MYRETLLVGALLCAFIPSAHALDFHPLASLELNGGSYSFDNFIIPEGVTVTLVGEPRALDLVIARNLRVEGDLVFGDGWSVTMLVEGDAYWHGETGVPRDVMVGIPAPRFPSIDPRTPPGEGGLQTGAGGDIDLNAGGSGGGITTTGSGSNPPPVNIPGVPEPEMWAMLLVGLGLVGYAASRQTMNRIHHGREYNSR